MPGFRGKHGGRGRGGGRGGRGHSNGNQRFGTNGSEGNNAHSKSHQAGHSHNGAQSSRRNSHHGRSSHAHLDLEHGPLGYSITCPNFLTWREGAKTDFFAPGKQENFQGIEDVKGIVSEFGPGDSIDTIYDQLEDTNQSNYEKAKEAKDEYKMKIIIQKARDIQSSRLKSNALARELYDFLFGRLSPKVKIQLQSFVNYKAMDDAQCPRTLMIMLNSLVFTVLPENDPKHKPMNVAINIAFAARRLMRSSTQGPNEDASHWDVRVTKLRRETEKYETVALNRLEKAGYIEDEVHSFLEAAEFYAMINEAQYKELFIAFKNGSIDPCTTKEQAKQQVASFVVSAIDNNGKSITATPKQAQAIAFAAKHHQDVKGGGKGGGKGGKGEKGDKQLPPSECKYHAAAGQSGVMHWQKECPLNPANACKAPGAASTSTSQAIVPRSNSAQTLNHDTNRIALLVTKMMSLQDCQIRELEREIDTHANAASGIDE